MFNKENFRYKYNPTLMFYTGVVKRLSLNRLISPVKMCFYFQSNRYYCMVPSSLTIWNDCGRNPAPTWSVWRTSWPLWVLACLSSLSSQTTHHRTHVLAPGTCVRGRETGENYRKIKKGQHTMKEPLHTSRRERFYYKLKNKHLCSPPSFTKEYK